MAPSTVDKMTLQQAMDYAVKKIVKQGYRCMRGKSCSYDDGHGRHCAVGWLLDARRKNLMEFKGNVYSLIDDTDFRLFPGLLLNNQDAFRLLQHFHDSAYLSTRREHAADLTRLHGVDTTAEHWRTWINMGKEKVR